MKKEERILNALGEVDDSFISEAAPHKKSNIKRVLIRWSAVAACLVLTAAWAVGIWGLNSGVKKAETVKLENGETISFIKSDFISIKSASWAYSMTEKDLTKEQTHRLFGDLPIKAKAVYTDEDGSLIGINGKTNNVTVEIAVKGGTLRDTIIESSDESFSLVDGVCVRGGLFLTDKNSRGERNVIYYASFKLGSTNVYVESAGDEKDSEKIKDSVADVIYKLIKNGEINTDIIK